MCNPDTVFQLGPGKAQALDFTGLEATWGLTSRFKGCLVARHPWVLIMDDDLFLTEPGLRQLTRCQGQQYRAPDQLLRQACLCLRCQKPKTCASDSCELRCCAGRMNATGEYVDPGKPGLHPNCTHQGTGWVLVRLSDQLWRLAACFDSSGCAGAADRCC